MSHLAYLGRMLEKGGGFVVRIFLEGLVLSRDCPNPLKWHTCCSSVVCCFWIKYPHFPVTYCADRETWDICRGYVGGLCPRYGGFNSPPTPHLAPGVVGRAYH